MVFDYEVRRGGGLRELWEKFVVPAGGGIHYTNEPRLYRAKVVRGGLRGWIMEQSGGMDI